MVTIWVAMVVQIIYIRIFLIQHLKKKKQVVFTRKMDTVEIIEKEWKTNWHPSNAAVESESSCFWPVKSACVWGIMQEKKNLGTEGRDPWEFWKKKHLLLKGT